MRSRSLDLCRDDPRPILPQSLSSTACTLRRKDFRNKTKQYKHERSIKGETKTKSIDFDPKQDDPNLRVHNLRSQFQTVHITIRQTFDKVAE
jgi:hypothetical protein